MERNDSVGFKKDLIDLINKKNTIFQLTNAKLPTED